MALIEKLAYLLGLEIHIVNPGLKANPDGLSLLNLRLGLFILLLFTIHIFTIIHDFGNRGL